jgi:hypothetical protein
VCCLTRRSGWAGPTSCPTGPTGTVPEHQAKVTVFSSVPSARSLEKVQVKRAGGSVKGLKGLTFAIMSQSCVRVRAGASAHLQVCSWLIIRDFSPYSPLRVVHCASDLRKCSGTEARDQRTAAAASSLPTHAEAAPGVSRGCRWVTSPAWFAAALMLQSLPPAGALCPSGHSQLWSDSRGRRDRTADRPPRRGTAARHGPWVLDSLLKQSPYSPLGPSFQHGVATPAGPVRD